MRCSWFVNWSGGLCPLARFGSSSMPRRIRHAWHAARPFRPGRAFLIFRFTDGLPIAKPSCALRGGRPINAGRHAARKTFDNSHLTNRSFSCGSAPRPEAYMDRAGWPPKTRARSSARRGQDFPSRRNLPLSLPPHEVSSSTCVILFEVFRYLQPLTECPR